MNKQLQDKLTLFAGNAGAIKDDFIMREPAAKRLAALIYSLEGKEVDTAAIRDAYKMIKDEVGFFSQFRGNLAIYLAAALSLSEQPKQMLEDTLLVYDQLKSKGFWASDFLTASAYEIALNTKKEDHSRMVSRTREFYDEMKANHRFLIGSDDYIFAAMLALSGMDPHQGANKLKQLYQRAKAEFSFFISNSSLMALSQMLVLGGSTEECVLNLLRLNRTLRNYKLRLDRGFTLPSLAVLGMLGADHSVLAEDIVNSRDFLRSKKGLGHFSVTTQELLLYVVSLITYTYADDIKNDIMKANITTSVTNLIIAQQAAMIAAISASSAAAAASS